MVGSKNTQTRVVGITDKMYPYTFFIETLSLENWMQGCISSAIIPTTLICAGKSTDYGPNCARKCVINYTTNNKAVQHSTTIMD